VRHCQDLPGQALFQFVNDTGDVESIDSSDVNAYIRGRDGLDFSAKDFRTWAGTLICACALARPGKESGDTRTARKRQVVAAIKATANVLGNTPAVCRSSYICPEIIYGFEKGKTIGRSFNSLDELINYRGRKLHAAEKSLLAFMKRSANT